MIFPLLLSLNLFTPPDSSLQLLSYEASPCMDEGALHLIQERIVSKVYKNDTLLLEIATVANCCLADTGNASISGNYIELTHGSKPRPIRNSLGEISGWEPTVLCDCNCMFLLRYQIKLPAAEPGSIRLQGRTLAQSKERYIPARYMIHQGDSLPLNDSLGFSYTYRFHENGRMASMTREKGSYKLFRIWYTSGQIKYEHIYENKQIRIRKWDQNGILTYDVSEEL